VEAWLDRLGGDRPADAMAQLAPGLAGIRERGWAVEVEDRLRERLTVLAAAVDGTVDTSHSGVAEQAAALRRVMAEIGRAFALGDTLPAAVDPAAEYRVSAINAPVFDANGSVVLVLCLVRGYHGGHPPAVSGADVLALGERVRAASATVTAAVFGRVPPSSDG
jgi:hypothetical protein